MNLKLVETIKRCSCFFIIDQNEIIPNLTSPEMKKIGMIYISRITPETSGNVCFSPNLMFTLGLLSFRLDQCVLFTNEEPNLAKL